jgi:hypothetical protein
LQKKSSAEAREEHRTNYKPDTTCFQNYATNTNEEERIESKANWFLGKNQFGFRKVCGTRDTTGLSTVVCELSLVQGNDAYICLVDFEKAFDRVNWIKMKGKYLSS